MWNGKAPSLAVPRVQPQGLVTLVSSSSLLGSKEYHCLFTKSVPFTPILI